MMPGAGDKDLRAPHLARLTQQSVDFPRAYVCNPVCSPSRAALQTGRYPHSTGMPWNNRRMDDSVACAADRFRAAGYQTGYIGKWHLDGEARPGFVPKERRRGYSYWAAFNRGHFYYSSTYFAGEDQPIKKEGFEPDYQTDLAVDFLKRNAAQPFFLFVSFGPPHTPRRAPAKHAALYQRHTFTLRDNVPYAYAETARKERVGYYGLCSALDDCVGRLLGALDELKLSGETIVIFTADHGDMMGSHKLEHKGVWYEESAGVPLLIRWPGKLKGGTKQDWLFNNIDMAPTLLGLCGLTPLPDAHGENRAPLLLTDEGERPESIYTQGRLGTVGEWRMVVRGADKLVVDRELRPIHLYNLVQDPLEQNDLISDRSTIRRQEELLALMRRWILKTADRVPYPGRAPVEEQGL